MEEFGLDHAKMKGDGWLVEFGAAHAPVPPAAVHGAAPAAGTTLKPVAKAAPSGTPVTSPMTGIYYSSASPGSPPFVRVGEAVTAGQVVALIEAMKVFNEVTAPLSGTVSKIAAENGQLVQPGDAIVYIG